MPVVMIGCHPDKDGVSDYFMTDIIQTWIQNLNKIIHLWYLHDISSL